MKLDLNEFFRLVERTPYILVKIDSPYVPKDFPDTYAVGKDVDVIIKEEYLVFMKWLLRDYAEKYKDDFEIVHREVDKGVRLRFEKKGKLHFQIDVSCYVGGLPYSFIEASIDHRKEVKNYFVAEERYEIIYRYCYYQKKKKKKYHLDYIRKNILKVDNTLCQEVGVNPYGIN